MMNRKLLVGVYAFLSVLGQVTFAHAGYDKSYIGETVEYRAAYEDTFVHLARKYNLGYVEMRAANPDVDPWIPGRGARLTLPTQHILPDTRREGVVINLPEMRLYAYVNGDDAPTTFPIGIGREGLDTPKGVTKIVRKTEGPVWRPTERMRREKPELPEAVYPGPENPLGTHALYLGWPTYAIHGTNRPFGIGRRVSSGCIRLYPESVVQLFNLVPVGTRVEVIDQPIKLAWIDDYLYLEAHPTIEQAIAMEETGRIELQKITKAQEDMITEAAGEYADRLRWPSIRTALKERRGYPVVIARRSKNRAEYMNDLSNTEELINEVRDVPSQMSKVDGKSYPQSRPEESKNKKAPLIAKGAADKSEKVALAEPEQPKPQRSISYNE